VYSFIEIIIAGLYDKTRSLKTVCSLKCRRKQSNWISNWNHHLESVL